MIRLRFVITVALLALFAFVAWHAKFGNHRTRADLKLCEALESGNTNFLQNYFVSGGNPNRTVQYGPKEPFTAPLLDLAIRRGQLETVDFLLEKGADPNLRDWHGHTPLEWAI